MRLRKDREAYTAETSRPDFMQYLLNNIDSENGMSRNEIDSTATFLIFAGSDTIALTCSSVTWFLLKNPDAYWKLRQEVRETFLSFGDITISTAAKLPYLRAIIQEALRLNPAESISVPR